MPANINSMMYVGEKPWHGLGTKLEKAATSAEAIQAAGLDWKVAKKQLYLEGGKKVVNAFATVREDTGEVLGVVGRVYQPLQNKDAFRFFDAVVGLKEAMYHTAGALGDGECVWILAKLPGLVRVVGDDITEKYLLLTNRHDGWGSATVMFTPIRVVCQNTLNVALSGREVRATLRHTATIGLRVDEVRRQLGIIHAKFGMFEEAAQRLAAVQLTQQAFKSYLKRVGLAPEDKTQASARATKIMEEVTRLFESGKGAELPGARGTAWGAFNAVVEYADFYRATRGKDDGESSGRTKSILFGSGATLKQKGWDEALALAR
jgi:phage/plasmid-like protein (TIGR03299 family)